MTSDSNSRRNGENSRSEVEGEARQSVPKGSPEPGNISPDRVEELVLTAADVRLARSTLRDPIFKTAMDIHGRAIESAIYRMANSEVARCYLRLIAAQADSPEAVTVTEALRIVDEAIDQVFDHSAQTFAVLAEGLHAQIFGIYSLGDPRLSHAALADGGQIHEAAHALIRALPALSKVSPLVEGRG